ncbi:uncharacterized protein LOC119663357, partial [Teleopsis dalmanni]|uniref:uncharacterized protein LOC119663357 n=1 Tax=Teleopsis dalmanni TaxID=139649 RepID=UPI0018CFCE6B
YPLFFSRLTIVSTQLLEIHNFKDNYSILPLQLGPARTIENYYNLIHIVNLEEYKSNINSIKNLLNKFENRDLLTSSLYVTKIKLRELENKLITLTPIKRSRRGLINGLGTTIKFITGNMDSQDADNINKQIENIRSNINIFNSTITNQHWINLHMVQRFNDIALHINREQKIIESFLDKTANKIKEEQDNFIEIQYLNQINFNIELLASHISDIAEAVILSRLNILPKLLLSSKELEEIKNSLDKQEVTINTYEQIYELLNLQAYYNQSNIIFNIQIHYDTAFPKIEGIYFCNKPRLEELTAESECMGRLMRNQVAHCPSTTIDDIETITQPEPDYVLLMQVPKTDINSSCNIKHLAVEGTVLIHFKNCSITINSIHYEDDPNIFWDNIYILPPPSNDVHFNSTKEVLNLHTLKAFNLATNLNLQQFEKQTSTWHCSFTTFAVATIIILALIIFFKNKTKVIQYIVDTPDTIAPTPSNSLWPSLYSKGGGVTITHQAATQDDTT